MNRAIIRIIIEDQPDEKLVELKRQVEALVKDLPKTEVELSIMSR